MNYYYYNKNKLDYPYISSPKNNPVKTENPLQKCINEKDLNKQKVLNNNNISPNKEDYNSIKTENENRLTGKFRFINPKVEKQDNINKNNEFTNDKKSYPTENLNNKNNNQNKITNNICIIINKPEVKDTNKNNNNSEYINNDDDEEENNMNTDKKMNNIGDDNFNSDKKNKTYSSSYYKQSNKKSPNEYIEEIDNHNDYSYMETEPNKKIITLHKQLKEKKQKLRDLERTIEIKENSLKEKKSKANIKEKKVVRSTTFDRGALTSKKINDGKGESITYDSSDYYTAEKKKKPYKRYINIKSNLNTNLQNKFVHSQNQIFSDIPLIKIQKQKLYDDEEDNIYSTMSPDATRDKGNISFNQSIEQKRRILGIPLYKNEFQRYNKKRINNIKKNDHINIEEKENNNIDKEQKKNVGKLSMYKRRQDEILRIYEKKNILNRKSRDYIKSKNKTPIRINYYDKQKKGISFNNIFDNDNNNNNENNNNKQKDKKDMKINKSYVVRHSELKKKDKKNQKDIPDNKKSNNKANNTINHKDDSNNYLQNKIKVYKQKEKPKENKKRKSNNNNVITKDINRKSQDINELRPSPFNNNEEPPINKKIYDNNNYYSKIISKLFNYEFEPQKKNKKSSNNYNSDNKRTNNFSNSKYNNNKKSNLNINNYNNVSPNRSKLLYASPRHNEIMTIQDNENGKVLRVVKKRHKSPIKKPVETPQTIQNQIKFIEIKKPEKKEDTQEKTIQKKDYKNNVNIPGRGILALRRINQKIENYKNKKNIHIPSRKRKKTKIKNPQHKSLSQLKKYEKHPFGKIRQNKSIKTLPDVNKEAYKNFDFINDL